MRLNSRVFQSTAVPVVLLATTVLLLQLGMRNALIGVDPALHPEHLAATILHDDCAADGCPMDDCTPQQECDMSGGAMCHCSCAQIPSLASSAGVSVAALPEMVAAEFGQIIVARRLDRPFRPPA